MFWTGLWFLEEFVLFVSVTLVRGKICHKGDTLEDIMSILEHITHAARGSVYLV